MIEITETMRRQKQVNSHCNDEQRNTRFVCTRFYIILCRRAMKHLNRTLQGALTIVIYTLEVEGLVGCYSFSKPSFFPTEEHSLPHFLLPLSRLRIHFLIFVLYFHFFSAGGCTSVVELFLTTIAMYCSQMSRVTPHYTLLGNGKVSWFLSSS